MDPTAEHHGEDHLEDLNGKTEQLNSIIPVQASASLSQLIKAGASGQMSAML